MRIHRRQFLKYCIGSAAALSLPTTVIGRLSNALAADGDPLPKIIWLNAANCTGCTVSLANRISDTGPADIADLLLNTVDLAFHPNLMGAAGDLAVQRLKETSAGDFILVVDGGVPTAFDGHTCILWTDQGHEVTAKEAVETLAPKASAVVSIGTCASYGGIPAGDPNPTGIVPVDILTGIRTINIPGCPPHPDWVVWAVANLLGGVMPELDDRGRPRQLYNNEIHKRCSRKEMDEAKTFGDNASCLKSLGCKGPRTKADCAQRKWNNGENWCIGANAICLGCTEFGFPDKFSPFYKVEYGYHHYDKGTEGDGSEANPEENPDTRLRIAKSEWSSEKAELKVEGEGVGGAIVKISDAESGILMGAVSVGTEDRWRFRQKNPVSIPTRVKAASNGKTVFAGVKNAPATGGEPASGETKPFIIKKAEWRSDKSELKVEGEGSSGTIVIVSNAENGDLYGMVSVDTDARWRFTQKNPVSFPSKVRAECGGVRKEAEVTHKVVSGIDVKSIVRDFVNIA